MAKVPFFRFILPNALTPNLLANRIMEQLQAAKSTAQIASSIDMGALPRISAMLSEITATGLSVAPGLASKPTSEMVS